MASGVRPAIEKCSPHLIEAIAKAVRGRNLSVKVPDEFPGCLIDLCRTVAHAHANHPAFIERGHTAESLLKFFGCECLRLLREGPHSYIKFLGSPAAETHDPLRLVILDDNLRIDLTVTAFDRLIR